MPRRKTKKHKRTKHRKSKHSTSDNDTTQSNYDSRKRPIIYKLLQHICKPNTGIKDIAEVVSSVMLSDEELKDMIKTSWCDSTIDSRMTDLFIDVLVGIRKLPEMNNTERQVIILLFEETMNIKRKSYMNECIKWCLKLLKSLNITSFISQSCIFLKLRLAKTSSIFETSFLDLICYLFNNNALNHTLILDHITNATLKESNKTMQLKVLCRVSEICGKQFYNVIRNCFDEILDEYLMEYRDTECPMCFESLLFNASLQTPCKHIFCCNCIEKWIETHGCCAVCKAPCDESQLESESIVFIVDKISKMRDRWRLESELDDNDDIDTDEKSENNN
eukprot:547174_1